jgi:hypothetical protein
MFALTYHDVRQRYKKYPVHWTPKRINEETQKRVGSHPSLKGFFELTRPQLNDLLKDGGLPSIDLLEMENEPAILRTRDVKRLVMNNLTLFGIAPRHYYVPNIQRKQLMPSPKVRGEDLLRDVYVLKRDSVKIVHTFSNYNEFYEAIVDERLTPILTEARNTENGAILFDFPFHLETDPKVTLSANGMQSNKPTFNVNIPAGEAKSGVQEAITFTYVLNDKEQRRTANEFALLMPTPFLIDYMPLHIDGVNVDWADFQHRIVHKLHWEIVTADKLLRFSRRSGI